MFWRCLPVKWDNKKVALLGVVLLVAGFLIGSMTGYNRALQTVFGDEEYMSKTMWDWECMLYGDCKMVSMPEGGALGMPEGGVTPRPS